jgi:hypothetical protein
MELSQTVKQKEINDNSNSISTMQQPRTEHCMDATMGATSAGWIKKSEPDSRILQRFRHTIARMEAIWV